MRRTQVWLLVDDSGSMYATWGDPDGRRYAAAQSLLGLMRRSGGGRAGVVHWGSSAPEAMLTGLTDLRRGRRALDGALTMPWMSLGGTDLPAALRRVAEHVREPSPAETLLVVPITDGIEDVRGETHLAVQALPPGCVHTVLVDRASQCDADMEAAWRSVAFGSFTRLRSFDTRTMAEQLASVLADALALSPADDGDAEDTP